MYILISNDDGIDAEGIRSLVKVLSSKAEVTVVAPLYERSGASHSLTVHQPLQISEVVREGVFLGYGVNGSPADCVKLGLKHICKKKPDIIISGINRGPNNAFNIHYSGTVGAAAEGAVNGIMSFAVSLTGYNYGDYSTSAEFMGDFIDHIHKLPEECLLYNINIPPLKREAIKGVRFTKASAYSYLENYDKGVDPFGRDYYWLSDFRSPSSLDSSTDDFALSENCISITPLVIDRTDYNALNKIKSFGDIW